MVGRLQVWADAGPQVGAGHLLRSRVLAEALQAWGWQVAWQTPQPDQAPASWAWAGLSVEAAPQPLGTGDLLLIDGYQAAAPSDSPCVRIHDFPAGPAPHADLLIEGMPGASAVDYPHQTVCAGLPYALLRADFVAPSQRGESGPPVVVLGGTDAAAVLPALCDQLLAQTNFEDIILAGVSGAPSADPRLRAVGPLSASVLAEWFQRAPFALVTASGVALEALASGCPVVAIQVAPNQQRLADALRTAGVPVLVAHQFADLSGALAQAACPEALRPDGQGARRAASRIQDWWQCRSGGLLRPAHWGDAQQLYDWLQDPGVRAASLQGHLPSWDQHCTWLRAHLDDPDCRLYLALGSGQQAVGTLRLQRSADADEALVSISTDPACRGQGLGPRMLSECLRLLDVGDFTDRLRALVRHDNPASLRCFSKAGFVRTADSLVHGHPTAVFCYERNTHVRTV